MMILLRVYKVTKIIDSFAYTCVMYKTPTCIYQKNMSKIHTKRCEFACQKTRVDLVVIHSNVETSSKNWKYK